MLRRPRPPIATDGHIVPVSPMRVSHCPDPARSRSDDRGAPHATGAAVDVTLQQPNGAAAAMGTDFDAFEPRAHTRWYERRVEAGEPLTAADRTAVSHRRLLFWVMTGAGFSNYPDEWWHFSLGDQFQGAIRGERARYGLAVPPKGSSVRER